MKRPFTRGIIALAALLSAVSCQDYMPDLGGAKGEPKPPSEYFSFNTTKQVSLSIDYGARGSKAMAEVYIKNPAYTGEDGQTYFKGRPVFKAHCDENGRFEGKINLPTYVDKVYIYTMRMGVPQLVSANVENSAVAMSLNPSTVNEWIDVNPNEAGFGYDPEEAATNAVFKNPIAQSTVKEKDATGKEIEKTYKIWEAPKMNESDTKNIYSIVNWAGQRFGRIIPTHFWDMKGTHYALRNTETTYDNQGLITDGFDSFEAADIDVIQQFLWDGNTTKQTGLDNTSYQPKLTKDINVTIPKNYLKNGELVKIDGVQVWIRFLAEGAWYCDGIGYYYYKTGEEPKQANAIQTYYVAIPNTSSTMEGKEIGITVPFSTRKTNKHNDSFEITDEEIGDWFGTPNSNYTFNPKNVPFDTNQRVQLLYHTKGADGTVKVSKYFPPGITIGFFVCPSPNNSGGDFVNPDNKTMRINSSNLLHSDNALNGGTKRYIALNYKDVAVYGVEDGTDKSFEDILFTVETDPVGLAVNPDRTTIEDPTHEAIDEYKTYAYEDIWPRGGDYDINDVVIEHYHKMTYLKKPDENNDKKMHHLSKIEDEFIAVQPSNAATYRDAFAIQIPKGHLGIYSKLKLYKEDERGRTELPIEKYIERNDEEKIESVILFSHIMNEQFEKRILVREFEEGELYMEETRLEELIGGEMLNLFNPFIISQYTDKQYAQRGRIEIHLPKHSPTFFAREDENIGQWDDAYYIDKDGRHPFAISIPVPVISGEEEERFIVTEEDEGKRIGTVYPDFEKWVKASKIQDKTEREAQLERYGDWYLRYGKSKDDPTP